MAKIWQMHAGLPSVCSFRGPFSSALKAAATFLYHLTFFLSFFLCNTVTKLEHKTTQ